MARARSFKNFDSNKHEAYSLNNTREGSIARRDNTVN